MNLISKTLLVAAIAGGCLLTTGSATTVITNDGFTGNNGPIPDTSDYETPFQTSTYGSNASADDLNWTVAPGSAGITGTPDISLLWSTGFYQTYTNWDGRGNVVQLDSVTPASPSPIFQILFTPTEAFSVELVSFDLDAWSGAPGNVDLIVEWTLSNADFSEIYLTGQFTEPAAAGGRQTIDLNYAGAGGEGLLLTFQQIQGDGAWLALDNVTFDQVHAVPEPSTAAGLTIGLAAAVSLVGRRRRRAKRSAS